MEINLQATKVFEFLWNSKKRFCILQGGTRSSKTYSVIQYLILTALQSEEPITISIVRHTLPSLKKTVLRDFLEILDTMGLYDDNKFNKTDLVYTIGKSKIEFFSLDNANKVRGSKREILFINEITDDVVYEAFFQLNIRTKTKVILDYNPSSDTGWWIDLKDQRKSQVDFMISTYKDNPFLSEEQVQEIEMLKETDDEFWQIYGLGTGGKRRDLIYNYTTIDSIPKDTSTFIGYGLDFGFAKDPAACIGVWQKDNTLYIEEIFYEKGLINEDINLSLGIAGVTKQDYIVGDSAEPKSIEELRRKGWKVYPAKKGPDSVRAGINGLRGYKLVVTEESYNLIHELKHYKYKTDNNGILTNIPTGLGDHALDALRYVYLNLIHNNSNGNYNISVAGSGLKQPIINDQYREYKQKYSVR